jgi:hypothetical protein
MSNPFDHIEEAWGFDKNPFSHAAISSASSPYSPEVFPEETAEFQQKIVRGALQGNRQMGFLWSKGPGGDTGYGKTSLMRHTVEQINRPDWGEDIQIATGMKSDRTKKLAAGFSELNTNLRTGLYPVIFNAVLTMATGEDSPLVRAHAAISEAIDTDSASAIIDHLYEARLMVAPTSSPLRVDFLNWFAESPMDLASELGQVSPTTQLRSGIEFLHFALIALRAAGVDKVFLMIDQLEDLATNKALPASKRRREIGRIRDLLETEPFASVLHQTFTFHATAARELDSFWEANRLPSFEDTPSNQAAVVVLRGMRDDDQVEALLTTWMAPHRNDVEVEDELVPFERSALSVLRQVSQGRPGDLLNKAHEVFDAGAQAQVGKIDSDFVRNHFQGASGEPSIGGNLDEDTDYAAEVEDLLA